MVSSKSRRKRSPDSPEEKSESRQTDRIPDWKYLSNLKSRKKKDTGAEEREGQRIVAISQAMGAHLLWAPLHFSLTNAMQIAPRDSAALRHATRVPRLLEAFFWTPDCEHMRRVLYRWAAVSTQQAFVYCNHDRQWL